MRFMFKKIDTFLSKTKFFLHILHSNFVRKLTLFNLYKHYLYIIIFSLFAVSCKITKTLDKDQYALNKNEIIIKKGVDLDLYEIESFIKQKESNKFFIYTWAYNKGYKMDKDGEKRKKKYKKKIKKVEEKEEKAINKKKLTDDEIYEIRLKYGNKKNDISKKYSEHGKLKYWLMNTVGEAPVIFDSVLMKSSIKQLEKYLFNKGYFNASIDFNRIRNFKYNIKFM